MLTACMLFVLGEIIPVILAAADFWTVIPDGISPLDEEMF